MFFLFVVFVEYFIMVFVGGVLWWCLLSVFLCGVFYYGVFGGVVFCGFDPLVIRL